MSWLRLFRRQHARSQAVAERLCVKSMCYALVDTYVQMAAPAEVPNLYAGLPEPWNDWQGRARLTTPKQGAQTTLSVWNQFFLNYLHLMRSPEAGMQVGSFISHPLFNWGTIRALSHSVVQIGTPALAYGNSQRGNNECNANKNWQLVFVEEKNGVGEVHLRMTYRYPGEDYPNRDIPSLDFIIGILRAVPMMFPYGVPAEYEVLQLECGVLPYLKFYQPLCALYGTATQIEQVTMSDTGELVINDGVYGFTQRHRGRDIVRITRDLEYAGPHQLLLRNGTVFGAEDSLFRMRYPYQQKPFMVRLGQVWADAKYKILNRINPDPARPVPAGVEYGLTTQYYSGLVAEEDHRLEALMCRLYILHPEKAEEEMRRLTDMAECKDQKLPGHMHRVGRAAAALIRYFNARAIEQGLPPLYSEEEIEQIEKGGNLHDIGKIYIPDAIILAPRRLTDEERKVVERHPEIGYDMATGVGLPLLTRQCILMHHLQWEGGDGYPKHLPDPDGIPMPAPVGKDIPLHAQCVAIADVTDAVRWRTLYKDRATEEEARAKVEEMTNRFGHFDPNLLKIYWQIRDSGMAELEIREIEEREAQTGLRIA